MSHPLSRGTPARAAFNRLVESESPLFFLDLDGTLAPLVADPAMARVPAATRRALQALRRTGVQVVLVSGRSIDGVRRVAATPVDAILGDHGARALIRGRVRPWIAANRARLTKAVQAISALVDVTPGIVLEQKDRSLAIHLRILGQHSHPAARRIARRLRERGLRVLEGHRVLDGQLPGVNKGVAVTRWLARTAPDAVLYAGDDTTDEDAFRALRGRGMVIGVGPRATGAAFRTRDPSTFATWLARLAAARSARGAAR